MAKFHFLVPLLSKRAAGERWLRKDNPGRASVEATVNACLRSLLNQSASSDVMVHLVCHDVPIIDDAKEGSLSIHQVSFSDPFDIQLEEYNRLSGKVLPKLPGFIRRRVGDKYSKIKVGLCAALEDPESTHVMFVDSDDLVHRNVVEFALNADPKWTGGHTVTSGYSWKFGASTMSNLNAFHKICGTCNVIKLSEAEKEQYARTKDLHSFDRKTWWLFAGHASVFQRLRNLGRDTCKIPFRAAVYVTATGANISGTQRSGNGQYELTDAWRRDFNVV